MNHDEDKINENKENEPDLENAIIECNAGEEHPEEQCAASPSFRETVMNRLIEAAAHTEPLGPIIEKYHQLSLKVVKMKLCATAKNRMLNSASDENSSRMAALNDEIQKMRKVSAATEQAIQAAKKELLEWKNRLAIAKAEKDDLAKRAVEYSAKVAELERQIRIECESKIRLSDDWITIKAQNDMLVDNVNRLQKQNIALSDKVRELQENELAALSREVSRHEDAKCSQVERDIASAIATQLDQTAESDPSEFEILHISNTSNQSNDNDAEHQTDDNDSENERPPNEFHTF